MPAPRSRRPVPRPRHRVRLSVSDIERSKDFYCRLLGTTPAADFTAEAGDRSARADPDRLYAGCEFEVGDQVIGLRPAGDAALHVPDHVTVEVDSVAELRAAAKRLDAAKVRHGAVREITGLGIAVFTVEDPDHVDLEMSAAL